MMIPRSAMFTTIVLVVGCDGQGMEPVRWSALGVLHAVQGSASADAEAALELYVGGDDGVLLRFDGDTWGRYPVDTQTDFQGLALGPRLVAVGCTPDEGDTGEIHVLEPSEDPAGGAWARAEGSDAPRCLRAVTAIGTGADGFIAVGDGGTILRGDPRGRNWSPFASITDARLLAVSAPSSRFALAVGSGGTVVRFDGVSWSSLMSPVSTDLSAVYARAPNDAYAAGAGGVVLHFDGAAWSALPTPTSEPLRSICGASLRLSAYGGPRQTILVAGTGNVAYALDGTRWVEVPAASGHDLFGLWASNELPEASVYAVGAEATVLELVFHESKSE